MWPGWNIFSHQPSPAAVSHGLCGSARGRGRGRVHARGVLSEQQGDGFGAFFLCGLHFTLEALKHFQFSLALFGYGRNVDG